MRINYNWPVTMQNKMTKADSYHNESVPNSWRLSHQSSMLRHNCKT